ncbi:MAG: tRNA 2-thiouridine(34) synthase MnmA [Dissulfurimicrobium sp.]|uniref:tRNA 2-thiouridine(34) synthase MnmA n=1 Tax=Dissulfurimicrobium sp. TaxID=2022436 RepID=UPI004049756E
MAGKRVLVAISGGVDSAVAALKSIEAGCHTEAFHLRLTADKTSLYAARDIAVRLGLNFHVIDAIKQFEQQVISYFKDTYLAGRTPNPCVVCNREIKIKLGLELASAIECDILATGHYARIVQNECGSTMLLKGLDPTKDQSYFLHHIPKEALCQLWFPNGPFTKVEIKKVADAAGLSDIVQEESQEICFLKGNYRMFPGLAPSKDTSGDITTVDNCVMGRHKGLWAYTIGQRHGIGIPDTTPYYVTAIDPARNRLIIGKEEDLYAPSCTVTDVNWLINDMAFALGRQIQVKIRYRHPGVTARLEPIEGQRIRVLFDSPQRAVTPGQFAVFYDNELVLGGGMICG